MGALTEIKVPLEVTPNQILEVDFLNAKTDKANLYWLPIGLEHPRGSNAAEQLVADAGARKKFGDLSELRFPVPAINLIRLATLAGQQSRKPIERLLRISPGLMLLGLAGFGRQFKRSPNSTKEFVQWCQPNLIGSLADIDFDAAASAKPRSKGKQLEKRLNASKLSTYFENHLCAQSNQNLKKSLRRFVVSFSILNKRKSRELVNLLVGKKLSAHKLKCKRRRSSETRSAIVDDWLRPLPHIEVGELIRIASATIESLVKFESRLLEEKMASMKQLAYGASHEINNPLANISTRAQTLLALEEDHEKRQKLAVIYEQAIRAHEMISDMMLFAHPPAIKIESVSVRLLIKKILAELEPALASNPGVDLRVTVGVGVEQVEVDVNQFCVALKNLIQNSFEAIASSGKPVVHFEGKIEVRFERSLAEFSQSGFEVSVWDNGQRIIGAVRRHLFDPFYSGREAGRGLGFGLSKVWTIAKLHGGSIRFDEQAKTGTRFVMNFPRALEQTSSQDKQEVEIDPRASRSVVESNAGESRLDEDAA